MPSITVTSDIYRKSAKEFFLSLKDTTITPDQVDNGFKCLTLMYMGLDGDEFNHLPKALAKHEHAYNVSVIELSSKYMLDWQLRQGLY